MDNKPQNNEQHSSTDEVVVLTTQVPENSAGTRLDAFLAEAFSDYSRSRLQSWIKNDYVRVDDAVVRKPNMRLAGLEKITVKAFLEAEQHWQAADVDYAVFHQDDDLLVINKRADLVVHPAAGHQNDTLVNGLLADYPELENLPRAGIIHRLDKDTTGLMVVPRNLVAHQHLVKQLQARRFLREYDCLVRGTLVAGGTIDQPLGRHPDKRVAMAVVSDGKPSVTHYRIKQKFADYTRLRVRLETGRTHQIRVHMAWLGHPLIGDQVYGGRLGFPPAISPKLKQTISNFKRQALHAARLGLIHPSTGETMDWRVKPPADMQSLLETLETEQ